MDPEDMWRRYLTALESIDTLEARIAYLESWINDLLEERGRVEQWLAQTVAALRDVQRQRQLRGDPDPELRGSYPYLRRPGEPINEE
jgi:hypothetical protein